jgi:hypothetical protein
MMGWRVTVLAVVMAVACPLFAEAGGTPEEERACRPDVRKFCSKLKPSAGDLAFLSCLKKNRAKLSKACAAVLKKHGQ